jgi:hypothetical protein
MPIELKSYDQKKLTKTIDRVLGALVANEVDLPQAREAIAHIVSAAAKGNEELLRSWLEDDTVTEWKKTASTHRT